jgi:hypothetical protein
MFVVQMNGNDFVKFADRSKAEAYVTMQYSKKKGGTEKSANPAPAYAATQKWTIVEQ